jgi:undecaprenyl-diphosphatase
MSGNIQNIDESILFYIQAHMKSPVMDRVMVFITSLGNAGLIWIAIALVLMYQKNYRKCGIYLSLTLMTASLLGDEVLKNVFHRIRPCNQFPEVSLLIHRPGTYSFPSGHTMAGFAAAAVLFNFNRKLGIAGYFMAFLIAFSRMYLFVHFPTDILGGILFGTLSSMLLVYGANRIYQILESRPKSSS